MAIIRPILILAIGAGLFFFFIQNVVDPQARRAFRQGLAAANADLISTVIQEGTFRRVQDQLYVQIGERLSGGQLGSIIVADARQPNTELIYYAKRGTVSGLQGRNALIMSDGVVHRKTADGQVSMIRFDSYLFDLSSFTVTGELQLSPEDQTLPYLFSPNPDDREFQQNPQHFRSVVIRRLTEWLYPIAFALVALAVAGDARSHRQARIHPLITAMVITLSLRWLSFFSAGEAQTKPIFVNAMFLILIVATVVPIWFIVTHRTMELPLSVVERITGAIRAVVMRIMPRRASRAV